MPRFFVGSDQLQDGSVTIAGRDAHHLARSLRVRPGEIVVVVEAERLVEHGVEVVSVDRDTVTGRIAWTRPARGEPAIEVDVLQAIPAQGMDDAVEALTVAGAHAVWPVLTARGVARPDASRAAARVDRWQAVATESAQLAGRAHVPKIHPVRSLGDAVAALPPGCRILACVTGTTATPLSRYALEPGSRAALVVGPEGGLDAADLRVLSGAGATLAHLGARVVPSRLAGFLALSLLLARSGDLDAPLTPLPAET
jgi:16S rRNA (uracil1498-N3)-methyltransferase